MKPVVVSATQLPGVADVAAVPAAVGTLIVMAKSPVAGLVKTRLTSWFTPAQAAALAQASLRDTLDTLVATPSGRRVIAWEGAYRPWLPAGVEVVGQRGDGLDERISHALLEALSHPGSGPALLVGMDTPSRGQRTSGCTGAALTPFLDCAPMAATGHWAWPDSIPMRSGAWRCLRLEPGGTSWSACGHWGCGFGCCR